MHSQQDHQEARQPGRIALFTGVFVAGMLGGAAVSGTFANGPQARPVAAVMQAGSVTTPFEVAGSFTDPSLPDAGTVLQQRKHERLEAVAPTF